MMIKCYVIGFFFMSWNFLSIEMLEDPYNNDLSILHLIKARGYPVELYSNLTTEDNYLLDLHRIMHGKSKLDGKGAPVLFMPPLLTSGEIFVLTEDALPFTLADLGYDIWIGHPRGSIYSRKHLYFETTLDSPYWLFSWHEKGYYDLPLFIDFIREKTGYDKVYLIGFSEGTSDFFVLASDRPEYNDKIKLAINLAPAVFVGHIIPALQDQVPRVNALISVLLAIGWKGIVFQQEQLYLLKKLETEDEIIRQFCLAVISIPEPYDIEQHAISPCYLFANGMHGVSVNELQHYLQSYASNSFRHFDYGPKMNLIKYGSRIPPDYNLKNVVAPVAIFYSLGDTFTPKKDVQHLISELGNIVYVKEIQDEYFRHIDFVARYNLSVYFYEDVIRLLKTF